MCRRVLVSHPYNKNPSKIEKKLPSVRPKTLTRRRERERRRERRERVEINSFNFNAFEEKVILIKFLSCYQTDLKCTSRFSEIFSKS